MSTITRLRSSASDFEATLKKLLAFDAEQDDAIEAATARILQRVRHEGDAALLELTNQFDQVNAPNVAALEIPAEQWKQALTALPYAQRQALEVAAERADLGVHGVDDFLLGGREGGDFVGGLGEQVEGHI